jgi:hypothetical protein
MQETPVGEESKLFDREPTRSYMEKMKNARLKMRMAFLNFSFLMMECKNSVINEYSIIVKIRYPRNWLPVR